MPSGLIKRYLSSDKELMYHFYKPKNVSPETRIFVTVHGVSLNSGEHAELFLSYAKKQNMILIAPHFAADRFPDYNCLGKDGERADKKLLRILDEVKKEFSITEKKIFLFGYSAGGQFAHRFSLGYPQHIEKLALGAPGYYTLPDYDTAFPQGLDNFPGNKKINMKSFYRIPLCLVVGSKDTQRGSSLPVSPGIDERQGKNRYARAVNWITAIMEGSLQNGFHTEYLFKSLPGCAHGFRDCMVKGKMGDWVFNFFSN